MAPASICASDAADHRLPMVHIELDSSDELNCDDNLTNSQSQANRNHEEMRSATEAAGVEERRAMLSNHGADPHRQRISDD